MPKIHAEDIIIAVDSGIELLLKNKIKPHYFIGDFDSVGLDSVKKNCSEEYHICFFECVPKSCFYRLFMFGQRNHWKSCDFRENHVKSYNS